MQELAHLLHILYIYSTNQLYTNVSDGELKVVGGNHGRPTKYKPEYDDMAYQVCLLGATIPKLASLFKVDRDTIYEWINTYDSFSDAIERGRLLADSNVAASLYKRAMGGTVKEQAAIKLTTKVPNHAGKIEQTERIEIVTLEREIPPDTVSMIWWLKNRQPKEWRDRRDYTFTNEVSHEENADKFTRLLEAARYGSNASGTNNG